MFSGQVIITSEISSLSRRCQVTPPESGSGLQASKQFSSNSRTATRLRSVGFVENGSTERILGTRTVMDEMFEAQLSSAKLPVPYYQPEFVLARYFLGPIMIRK